ncbi:SpoIIE family protein phosphatase [Balneolaceae bacterium YR4-1]|uniref:SpoIIE family protein phosphatase n=1 Tax=Halalkalibaculum roseum TaxID=2709311 RepID=A0A6M1T623_9BACT|nr:SpoIIE family protein phosphatase [Halalkalibaculum roseum]NGP75743.1 SpoIIE family protein phosphatase [Halalkalibaculum roseum]
MRTHKIMVVDDEPDLQMLILQKFRKKIHNDDYEFYFAENGQEALDLLNVTSDISLILSDINMPKMDGLTLLQKLQEKEEQALKTVIVSAYGDMENIRTAMNRGAFDFVTKPIDFTDLEVTIERGLKEIHYIRENLKQKNLLNSVQQDLDTASRIQQKILPQDFPAFPDRKEFQVYAEMHTAKEVGGDFYDFFMIDDNHLGFVIGDVSGKGVPASIYMAVSRTMLKAIASQLKDPAECLQTVNTMLIPESDLTTFVTIFYGVLNTDTGVVKYCNGGHNLPYHMKDDGSVVQVENTEGLLLGKIEPIQFQTKEIQLKPGEKMFLYTDGLTEAMNENDEMYEDERVEEYLRTHSKDSDGKLLRGIIVDTLKFMNKAHQSDDITLLVMEYVGRE